MAKKIDPKSEKTKRKLKNIGFICLFISGVCIISAFIDFFSSINSFGQPKLFFLFFIGFPLLGVGITCLNFGYMNKVNKYVADQTAPVVKDTINYILDETQDSIKDTVQIVKDETIKCSYCNNINDKDASYCDNCGKILRKTCHYCNTNNDNDAEFCKNCGKKLC